MSTFSQKESAAGSRQLTRPVFLVYVGNLTFARRALCAAAIRFLPATEIVRFGLAVE